MYHSTPDTTLRCCDSGPTGKRWKGFRKTLQVLAVLCAFLTCTFSAQAQTDSLATDTTLLSAPAPSTAVNVCTTSVVVAGFGVDGGLYANTTVVGSDDWFQGMLAGSGVGVIGEGAATSDRNLSGAAFNTYLQSASLVGRNRTYVQRMAQPFPWLVPAGGPPQYVLLDAVGARDNFASGAALDTSVFAGPSSKNGDNPLTNWFIGIGGVPQKNDLIDVGGHIRRDLTDGALWGYAFASTLSTDGNAHTDFEVFRTAPVFDPITGDITNTGPMATGGHTAGQFWGPGVNAGKVSAPGDLLVAIDYENGGAVALASVRIWIKPSDVTGTGQDTAWLNQQPNRPFSFTGVFDSGTNTNGYGYAEIRPNVVNPNSCLIYSVQNLAATTATPWGTIDGSQATYQTNYVTRQMMEVAINFSAFGLDIDPISGPCFNLFGSLLIKTRSSSSFTSELKDYSGPYVFGNFAEVQANAGPDQTVNCGQTTATLQGSSPTVTVLGGTFTWTPINGGTIVNNGNTLTPTVTAGCYILTVSHPSFGTCQGIDTVCVSSQNTPPGLTCGAGANLTCTTQSAQICASTTQPSTYSWTGPGIVGSATGACINVNAAGTYTVVATNTASGCTETCSITVTADNTPPGLQCGGGANLTCNTTSAQICASTTAASTYAWSGPGIVGSATGACINVNAPGTYTVVATNTASGCTESCSISVTQDLTPPGLQCGAGANLTCTTTSAQICASTTAASTYAWSGPGIVGSSTGACITVNAPGTYTVVATNTATGCTQSCSINVTQDLTPPGLQCGGGANLTCTTTSAQICATTTAASTYAWSGPGIVGSSTGACITVNAPGTYTVVATNTATGCTESCSINVTQDLTPPGLQCGAGANLTCTTTSAQICASTTAASTYAWSGPGIVGSSTGACITVNAPGTYTVVATNTATGCTESCSINVTQDIGGPGLQCGAGANLTCTTTSAQICATTSAASTYSWSGPGIVGSSTGACITVNAPGTYTVVATNIATGCTQSCSINVTQDLTPPGLNCGAGANLTCTTQSAQICASTTAASTYAWSGPGIVGSATGACITVNAPGTYTVIATNIASGCTQSCSIVVTQDLTPPGLQCGGGANLTCTTTSAQICASTTAASTYVWSGPGIVGANNGACITVNAPGTYTVVAQNIASGCTQTCSIVVTQDLTPPGLNCGAGANLTCTTTSAQICATTSNPSTYAWSGPGIVGSATGACITVNAPGTYTVIATNIASGCTQSCSIVVTQDLTLPGLQCGAGANLTCVTTSAQICASTTAPSTYSWTGPGIVGSATGACITVNAPGTYTVIATNIASGCTQSCSIVVTQDLTPPGLQCGNGANLTCVTTSAQICASTTAPSTYSWTGPGIVGSATGACITVNAPGTYTVIATNIASGCTQSCSIVITQDLTPPGLQCGGGANLTCVTTSAQICASTTAPSTYAWSGPGIVGSATGACITVNAPGTYTVIATNIASGCTQSCSIVVTQDLTPPGLQCGAGANLTCVTTSAQICASTTAPSTYSWTGPGIVGSATGACITVNAPGTYTVIATNIASGCTQSCSIVVTQDLTPPGLQCGGGANLTCVTTSAQICATTTAASTYAWSGPGIVGSATGACITVNAPGTYTVIATNIASGCTQSCSIVVTQDLTPPGLQCGAGANLTCVTTSAQICASTTTPSTYAWSGPGIVGSATGACITVNAPGTYTVIATNIASGCTQSCSIVVTQDLTPPGLQCGGGANLTCVTTSAQICASTTAPSTYSWTGPGIVGSATGACITVNAPGTYTVIATNIASGCTQSCSINVTQDLTPPGLQCGNGATINCANPTRTICATVGAPSSVVWSGPGIVGSNTGLCITVNAPGTYSVTATNIASGCTQSCSIVVGIDTVRPNVDAGANIKLTCAQPCKNLTATSSTPGVTFLWSTGATTATINVCAGGNYTVTATGPNGCTRSDVVCVSMDTVKPSLSVPNTVLNCYYPCRTLTATSSTPGVTYLWSTGATTASIQVCTAGNYTVTVTNPVNGCTRSKTACVTANFGLPNINAGADVTINCYYPCRTLTATSSTAGATFVWSTGATTASIQVCTAGTYVVTATNPNTGCTKKDTVCVKSNFTTPHCSLTAPTGQIICGSTGNTITKVVANATSYLWKFVGNSSWVITAGGTTSTMTYTAGTGPVTLRLIVSNGTSGCSDSCDVSLNCTTQRFCTYTMGGYGNPNGMRCNGQRTRDFVKTLLASGPLVIGAPGRSITFALADSACLIGRLPSGGPSVMLPLGNATCANPNQPLGNGGRLTNTLEGQTITLGLNMRIPGSTLGNLVLAGQYMITTGGTGTGCAGSGVASGSGSAVLLSSKVLNYLGGSPTVAQLYALANAALGGTYVPANSNQPSLSEINNTVAKINEGFDNCRMLGGFSNVNPGLLARESEELPMFDGNGIFNKAYPNPFNSATSIEFMMEQYEPSVSVDVYDMAGHKVASLYNGEVNAGVKMNVEFNAIDLPSGVYVYRIIAGESMVNAKLMLVK